MFIVRFKFLDKFLQFLHEKTFTKLNFPQLSVIVSTASCPYVRRLSITILTVDCPSIHWLSVAVSSTVCPLLFYPRPLTVPCRFDHPLPVYLSVRLPVLLFFSQHLPSSSRVSAHRLPGAVDWTDHTELVVCYYRLVSHTPPPHTYRRTWTRCWLRATADYRGWGRAKNR